MRAITYNASAIPPSVSHAILSRIPSVCRMIPARMATGVAITRPREMVFKNSANKGSSNGDSGSFAFATGFQHCASIASGESTPYKTGVDARDCLRCVAVMTKHWRIVVGLHFEGQQTKTTTGGREDALSGVARGGWLLNQ
jgi:hypothetical protein